MNEALPRNRRILFLIVPLLLVVGAAWFAGQFQYRPLDLRNYLAAAARSAAGHSPYEGVEFFGPPWIALMLVPLTWLPPAISAGLWLMASMTAVLALTLWWIEYSGHPEHPAGRLFAAAAAVVSPLALYVYLTGQISALVGAALLYLVVADRRPRARLWLAVVAALLASAKPHLVGIPLALLLLDDLRRRRWQMPITVAASLGGAALLSLLVLPEWPMDWVRALRGANYLGGSGLVAGGYIGIRELGVPGTVLALPLLYAAYYWFRRGPTPTAVALAIASNLVWIPYVRLYDQIVLWPVALGAAAIWRANGSRWIPLLAFLTLPLSDFSLVLPLVLLALLLSRTSIRHRVGQAPAG